jgi:glycosyltransferase involved in cell wall biosynthesis
MTGNPQSVANAILRVAEDATRRLRYSADALAAAPQYSRERHAEETLGLLEEMMEI